MGVMEESKAYWAKRMAKTQETLLDRKIEETEAQLIHYYKKSQKKIIGQFEITYNKVLTSMVEGQSPTPADLYRLDSYWKMQGLINEELGKLCKKQLSLFDEVFLEEYNETYKALAWESDDNFNKPDQKLAHQLIKQLWCADGESWSDRIWNNRTKLQMALNDTLLDNLINGRKPEVLKKVLQEQFHTSYYNASRIVRTELAHIQTQAAKQRYIDYGIKEVEVQVEADACPVCKKLKNKKFSAFGQMPVPVHPNCRCCVIPVIPKEDLQL